MLDRVTITGADDGVEPSDLLVLSKEFPFVEWGILASSKRTGQSPRYPSLAWMQSLRELAWPIGVPLSLHLCGSWVRLLLIGKTDKILHELTVGFRRVQLNFNPANNPCDPPAFAKALNRIRVRSLFQKGMQFIFQCTPTNAHMESLNSVSDIDTAVLFDSSGGRGILSEWPKPLYFDGDWLYHGYAGGLGPDNLAEQLPFIGKAAGDTRIWIDMETKVRSNNDAQFDLDKVRRCLEIASPFVTQQ